MKLGVNIINFGPGGSPDSLRAWARFAEGAGFAIAMISDRGPLTPDVQARYPAPFYDQFSGGRFVFGVGVGWSQAEYAALGVPFGPRGAITDEYLAAITRLWHGEVASMDGRFVSFREVRTGPAPARLPHPPIWVGGSSGAAIRRAVRFGDAWHPIDPRLDWLRKVGLPRLQSAADDAGQPVPALCPRINLQIEPADLGQDQRRTGVGSLGTGVPVPAPRCRGKSAYVLTGSYMPSRSARRTRMAVMATIRASSRIAAATSNPRENPVASACW